MIATDPLLPGFVWDDTAIGFRGYGKHFWRAPWGDAHEGFASRDDALAVVEALGTDFVAALATMRALDHYGRPELRHLVRARAAEISIDVVLALSRRLDPEILDLAAFEFGRRADDEAARVISMRAAFGRITRR